jgi:hypothetical protein
VVAVRAFVDFADQRNFGLRQFFEVGDWVLHLDADERLTPQLETEIASLDPPATAVAFNAAPLFFLRGRPIPRSSGFPVFQTRLTKAGAFEFEQVGHGQKAPRALGPLVCLRAHYEHHPFEKGPDEWDRRHRRYAEQEARTLATRSFKTAPWWVVSVAFERRHWISQLLADSQLRPWLVWAYLMFARGGILEGTPGWEYCRRRYRYERLVRELLSAQRRGRSQEGLR